MQIGAASSASGASVRALRHYEDEGLILPGRFDNGFRDYCQVTVDRVRVIRSLLATGLPVRLIREVLPASSSGGTDDPVSADFLREVERYRERLGTRIHALTAQYESLEAYLRTARRNDS